MNKKPNIIYILADDMGYGDVSALNENAGFKTPNFDSIYENGVAFCDAHSSSAVCTPSRYSILTGRYNWRSKLKYNVLSGYSNHLIEQGRTTVASMLQKNGYKTYAVGKWHLGMDFAKKPDDNIEQFFLGPENVFTHLNDGIDYSKKIECSPNTNGFDYSFVMPSSLDIPPYVYVENDHVTAIPDHIESCVGRASTFRTGPTAPDFVHEDALDVFTEKALEVLDKQNDDPFFLYFPLTAPHTPIMPSAPYQGASKTNDYGDFVVQCDAIVGKIIAKLKEKGIYENTMLVFTSDNGCSPTAKYDELAKFGHNPSYIFRGKKADIHEGGHRIPLLVQLPDSLPKGKKCNETVCLTDFIATVADIIGVEFKDEEAVDSVSNLPLLLNPEGDAVREYTVHQSCDGSLAIRKGKYKLALCPATGGWRPMEGVTDETPKYQLFDLENDICETTNIINEEPKVYEELKEIIANCVLSGRSTTGKKQLNNGEPIWKTVKWLEEHQ